MKKYLLLIFWVLCYNSVSAQDNLDSLYRIWQDKSQPDSTRVNAYRDYIWNGYLFSRPDTAEVLTEALQAYAEKHSYPKASGKGYHLQGIASAVQGNYPRALKYFQKSLTIWEEIGDKNGIASSLNTIGIIYKDQGNYPRALEYYQKSMVIFEELGDKNGITQNLINIGNNYNVQGNYPRALEYYQKSLVIFEELGDKKGIAKNLNNIGIIYRTQGNYLRALEYYQKSLAIEEELGHKYGFATSLSNIGNIYEDQGNYPRALEYLEKSLAIFEEIGDKYGIASSLNTIGIIYKKQGNYPHALEYYQKSLAISEEIGHKKSISGSLINVGILYKEQYKNNLALSYCQKGLALAEEIGALDWQKNACKCLYDTYLGLGKDKEALKFFEQMISLRDSIYNEENTKKLTRLEMQYDFDKKEAATQAEQEKKDAIATQELKRQKLVRNAFVGGFAIVFLFALVVFKQRNKISEEKARSEELLLNILPEETAKELKEKGSADAQLIDEVTVLFTDFKGFTAMSENMSPKDLVDDLHQCFSAFDHIMEKYGIEKIKTIGDAYMAAGGLPTPNSTHAADVVKAGLEMAEIVEAGKAQKIANNQPFFEIRIGVHTGPVVAGIVGIKKFSYDIWGDTVNTASRMESSGEVGKVNISETTFNLLKDDPDFDFESRGKIAAKGKGEVEMWFVTLKNKQADN
ncbi:MAG: tetratricopeptide repeat protein [Cryomorphaceae bacterium]|nr:tetratricopeptide repeat protein [Cryomorphaceae bacterium]